MTVIETNSSVRDVVIQLPESAAIFENLKIDYCCGGETPLTEACEKAGVSFDAVLDLLARAKRQAHTIDLQNISANDLIDHILSKHHLYTKQEIDRLPALVAKVLKAHGSNHPELYEVAKLVDHLCGELQSHMFKEERILFPYVRALETAIQRGSTVSAAPFGTVQNPLRVMMAEHDQAGELLRQLSSVTNGYSAPGDACSSYQVLYQSLSTLEKDLHQHIHLENNVLFPMAVSLESAIGN